MILLRRPPLPNDIAQRTNVYRAAKHRAVIVRRTDTVQLPQLAAGEEACFELAAIEITPGVRVTKSGRVRWAGHVARMGERRRVHRVLVGKPERKRLLGRPRRKWEDNIKMDLQEVGCGGAN
jgi:hypothetical protein